MGDELQPVRLVAELVKEAGGRALLVGGCVRDKLLGRKPKDFDIECFGLTGAELQRALAARFELDLVGISFGVIKLHHFDIDVALPRRETKLGLGHRAFEMEQDPSLTLTEASARRDFTVNAIYEDPLTGEILDPWNGRTDLEKHLLRHVSSHFSEDPLRVLRGMQFVARFDLTPAPETIEVCRGMTPEGLAPERLMGEWSKLLTEGVQISKGLEFLRAVGWTKYYPELERLIGCEQDPAWHPEGDVWNHTLCCLDAFAKERGQGAKSQEDLVVGLAVLCHDFGKPACTAYDPMKKRIRSLGHDEAGVEPTLSFLRRLTNEERFLKEVPPLVRLHMRPFAMWRDKSSDGAIRRLAVKVVRIDRLLRVAAADDAGRPPFPSEPEPLRWLAEQAERLRIADSAPKPIVKGRDLIALGMKPGVAFGRILKAAYEAQLDGAFADLEGGLAHLREHRGLLCSIMKVCIFACLVCLGAQGFALERQNIAIGRPYSSSRPPNYIYCTDPGDKTQLTDGYYDRNPKQIWVRKETVGWSVGGPEALSVTVDLGKVEPIAGVSFNFAAGMAGVNFPKCIYVYAGDDGKSWRFLGDVLRKSTVENTPPKRDGYEVYRAWSDRMPGRGRYVMFLISTTGYLFSDEIEVYRGDAKQMDGTAPGQIVADPFAHVGSVVVRERVEQDLKRLANDDRELAAEVERLAGTAFISNTILPLCETHRRVWAKNAKNLRVAGYFEPVLWKADRWANLDPFAVPGRALVTDDPLTVEMMRGEVRAVAVNFLNPTGRRLVYDVTVEGLPETANVDCREVVFTDTPSFVPVAAALVPGKGKSISLPVEAGTSKQLWISFHRPSSGSGTFDGRLVARAVGEKTLEKPVTLVLHDLDFPKACELHLGGFDYMIGKCDFYRAPGNVASHVTFFKDNYIDMPWATWGVSPQGVQADETGHIVNPGQITYRCWDEWVARFPEARLRAVFICAERFKGKTARYGYAGFDLGSPAFNRYVGEYFRLWADHMRVQGVDPKTVVVLIVDEPGDRREPTEYPKVIVAWANAVKAAAPEFRMMVDPDYEKDASIAGKDMYEVCDIICPKLDYTADPGHEFNRDFFLNRVSRDKLWFYQCNGPSRSLDPIAYYRQHFWSCWEYGAHAAAFWAFGCGGGIGNSWRAYAQTSAEYSPYFVGQTEVTPAKQSEGIREGMQDYEYLRMLKGEIAAAKMRGTDVALAEKVLARAVQIALNQTGGADRGAYSRADNRYWATDKDRSAPDRARLGVLRMISQLKEKKEVER